MTAVNSAYVAEYEANLTNLIQDLRAEFGVPNMPVVIGNTGMANAPSGAGSLIEAQGNVADPAKHPEFAGTVFTVDTRPFDYGDTAGCESIRAITGIATARPISTSAKAWARR